MLRGDEPAPLHIVILILTATMTNEKSSVLAFQDFECASLAGAAG